MSYTKTQESSDNYGEYAKKMSTLLILEVLKKHSDAEHPITKQADIIKLIKDDYGLKIDRHTLQRNLISLADFFHTVKCGYTIEYDERTRNKKDGTKVNTYHNWYLERDITDAELHLLIDGLLFSKYIPYSQCKALVEKLEMLSSKHFKKRHALPETQPENKQLLYTIDILNDAIAKNNKVAFQFTEYGTDKKARIVTNKDGTAHIYTVSPYEIVVTNGRYYLICAHSKGKGLFHYRLDYMREITIQKREKRRPIKEMDGCLNGLDLSKYMAEHIYMYSGESVRAIFRADKKIIAHIKDWFGENATLTDETEDTVTVAVIVNKKAMLYWALQYGIHVEVLQPIDLRDEIRDAVEKMHAKYSAMP